MIKVLVIGSGGMLGHVTTLYLRKIGYNVTDISKTHRIDENTLLVDVLKQDHNFLSINFLSSFNVIVNCAALLVGPSEKNKTEAVLLNSWFPHKLERDLQNTKTKLIQVSTDGVFSGSEASYDNAPYGEDSLTDTKTFYGKTKVLGELADHENLTVRASFVGPDINKYGTGLFHWFLQQSGEVKGYASCKFNAVTNLEFAKFADFAIKQNLQGLYHLGASETKSKAEFLRDLKYHFTLDKITVIDNNDVISDNTLLNTRQEIPYVRKSYSKMLEELKDWMQENKKIYQHYIF